MKRLFKKSIVVMVVCIALLGAMCLNAFAYQADMVKAVDFFDSYTSTDITCYGRLYVMNVGNTSTKEYAEGSAETSVSVRPSNITDITVEYWFEITSNPSVVYPHGYVTTTTATQKTTPSYSQTVQAVRCDVFKAEHRVVYKVSNNKDVIWHDTTIEEGVFFN